MSSAGDSVLSDADRHRWSALAAACPWDNPFAEPDVAMGLAEALGWRAEPLFVDQEDAPNGVPEAGLLMISRRTGALEQVVVPPFSPYSAVLVSGNADFERALLRLLDAVTARCADATVVLPPDAAGALASGEKAPAASRGSSVSSVSPQSAGQPALPDPGPPWSTGILQTYRADTALIDDFIASWSSSHRRTFRSDSDRYEFHTGSDLISEIVALTEGSYGRNDRPLPVPADGLSALARRLTDTGRAIPFGVRNRDTGTLEAGIVALAGAQTAWYWIAGSVPGSAMTICVAHAVNTLHERGLAQFDFMGANTPGIAEFKRRFGGRLVDYPLYETPTRRAVDWLQRLRKQFRRFG